MNKIGFSHAWAETLVQLGHEARQAPDAAGLFYVIANETYQLSSYMQAILIRFGGDKTATALAASGVAQIERGAPHVVWTEQAAAAVFANSNAGETHVIDPAALPALVRQGWDEYGTPHMLWCPVISPAGPILGALMLARREIWQPEEAARLTLLAESYGETWSRHERKAVWPAPLRRPRQRVLAIAGAIAVVLLLPVRNSALAPVQIVARDYDVVAAPMKGVIKSIEVHPDQSVTADHVLFIYDDTELRGKYAVAAREVDVADAALMTAQTQGVRDQKSNAEIARLTAIDDLRKAELASAIELYERVQVRAPRAGIVVMSDPEHWVGRPVETGERIMDVADSSAVEARINFPVGETIDVKPGARVDIFLNNNPIDRINATVAWTNYEATEMPDGKLAYRISAQIAADEPQLRIGLHGIARVSAGRTPLILYLLRKPLGILRQYAGLLT
jgi:multidrug resistance efflux pump